jgi:hypothetical protein
MVIVFVSIPKVKESKLMSDVVCGQQGMLTLLTEYSLINFLE